VDGNRCYCAIPGDVFCYDKLDGERKWSTDTGGMSCIALDENHLYATSGDSVIAMDKRDGGITVRYLMGEDGLNIQYNRNSIAVSDQYLCLPTWGEQPGYYNGLMAFNKETGELLWVKRYVGMQGFTPTIANGLVYCVLRDWRLKKSYLVAYEIGTGDSLWCDSSADYVFQPIVAQHTLFVSTLHGVKAFSNAPSVGIDRKNSLPQPDPFKLSQNHPNPFNPNTTIRYELPDDCHVSLKIYNMLGREVATLLDDHQKAGFYQVRWDASRCASGLYFYCLKAESRNNEPLQEIKKMLLLR
ncbi:PQQ-binding-like beta-propeller repeat protein, partial [bacterium]|nr:PQQ-binding-like beta-propeller repeat protein [bacterium]